MSKLICTSGPNNGDEWEVPFGTTIIGRQQGNGVVLHDPKASRQHAVIKFEEDKYVIEDLGSSNGTYVFGKKITRAIITPDTTIQIGNSTLVFTRKSIHGGGVQHMDAVGEDLLLKHKSKQAVMEEILSDIQQTKGQQGKKRGFFRRLFKSKRAGTPRLQKRDI